MPTSTDTFALRLVEFADQSDDVDAEDENADEDFVIPEELGELSVEKLTALHQQAISHFDTMYGDGAGLSDTDLQVLASLTEGIETLQAEVTVRESAQSERAEAAQTLAKKIHPDEDEVEDKVENEDDDTLASDSEDEDEDEEPAEDTVELDSKKEVRVNLSSVRSRQRSNAPAPPAPSDSPKTMKDVVLAADVPGFSSGQGMDWHDVGSAVDRRLASFNMTQYANAAANGRHMREQNSVLVIRKPMDPELVVHNSDPAHVDEVLKRAVDESRLPGGSLVASGGWCAPSEIIYDLCELESRDGLFSLPEIGIARGGIQWTQGPEFATIYAAVGFEYTEVEDAAGDYNGSGGGVKPCYKVPCPSFQEKRLGLAGLCLTAGLLQQRGYPEVLARTTRGALIAHDHKMSQRIVAELVAGSDAVTMTPAQVGTAAPLLDAIELQVEHYRYSTRIARSVTLEAVFPFWIRGAIRSDLARRGGQNLLDVTDGQIDGWFSSRGIAPQYIYNWQDITGAADTFVAWPSTVDFLLYSAGTWVKGGSDIITLDTIYDSVNLGTNDFTALFTEEGYLTAKLCHDSRVVTVPVSPDGGTNGGVEIAADGTKVPVA